MSDKTKLSHDLFTVLEEENRIGYGGSQKWYSDENDDKYGCGIAACADVALYLMCKNRQYSDKAFEIKEADGEYLVRKQDFIRLSERLRRTCLPIIPKFGVNSFVMALGMNKFFISRHMPFRCYWKVTRGNRWELVKDMLLRDVPVVLAVGANFPVVWGKHRVNLYSRNEQGGVMSTAVKAHYVVITAIDDEWLTISSWGRKYYIRRKEFDEYVRRYSGNMYSNILVIV